MVRAYTANSPEQVSRLIIAKAIGMFIRRLRTGLDLRQQDLADMLRKVSPGVRTETRHISGWEKAEHIPDGFVQRLINRALGIDPSYFDRLILLGVDLLRDRTEAEYAPEQVADLVEQSEIFGRMLADEIISQHSELQRLMIEIESEVPAKQRAKVESLLLDLSRADPRKIAEFLKFGESLID